MWKESYRIGVASIDRQHRALFAALAKLLKTVHAETPAELTADDKKAYAAALAAMKEHFDRHFKDEEAYMDSIGYRSRAPHQKIHAHFKTSFTEFERELTATGYASQVIKKLSALLFTWTVYHVSVEDRKITGAGAADAGAKDFSTAYLEKTIVNVFAKITGLAIDGVHKTTHIPHFPPNTLAVEIEITGDIQKTLLFAFSRQMALRLVKIMTCIELNEIDELVTSAMCEIASIFCGNMATAIAAGGARSNIKPPALRPAGAYGQMPALAEMIFFDTEIGSLTVAVVQAAER